MAIPNVQWLTSTEIDWLCLPGMPRSAKSVRDYLKRCGATANPRLCRPRQGKGMGHHYHYMALPLESIIALEERQERSNRVARERQGEPHGFLPPSRLAAIDHPRNLAVTTFIRKILHTDPDLSSRQLHALCLNQFSHEAALPIARFGVFQRYLATLRGRLAPGESNVRAS